MTRGAVDGGGVDGGVARAGATDFEGGAEAGDGGAEFVGDVGGEGAFAGEGIFETIEEGVEAVDHGEEFGGEAGDVDAGGEVGFGHGFDFSGDGADGADGAVDDGEEGSAADGDGGEAEGGDGEAEGGEGAVEFGGFHGCVEDAVGAGDGMIVVVFVDVGGEGVGDDAAVTTVGEADLGELGLFAGEIGVGEGLVLFEGGGDVGAFTVDPDFEVGGVGAGGEFGHTGGVELEADLVIVLFNE